MCAEVVSEVHVLEPLDRAMLDRMHVMRRRRSLLEEVATGNPELSAVDIAEPSHRVQVRGVELERAEPKQDVHDPLRSEAGNRGRPHVFDSGGPRSPKIPARRSRSGLKTSGQRASYGRTTTGQPTASTSSRDMEGPWRGYRTTRSVVRI